jgi:hypothetical protein
VQTPGYEVFLSKAKVIFEELEADFDTFVDALEWVKITQQTLSDISTATAELTVRPPLPGVHLARVFSPRNMRRTKYEPISVGLEVLARLTLVFRAMCSGRTRR